MTKPTSGIVVDGSCEGNPGPGEYRGIDIATGKVLFGQRFLYTTNNIMEFVALVHAIRYNAEHKLGLEIYSDSYTAISWVKNKFVKSEMVKDKRTELIWKFVKNCIVELGKHENIKINKWETKQWGENPADFGKKVQFINPVRLKAWIVKEKKCFNQDKIDLLTELEKYFNL